MAKKTDISMPTLQRYKKLYQGQIPARGKGRTQRYPEEALEVFRGLKTENVSRRGRPRKKGAPEKAAAAPKRTGRRRGRPSKGQDPGTLASRVKEIEGANRQLMRRRERVKKVIAGGNQHVASPATATEIRDALNISESDIKNVEAMLAKSR